MLDGRGEMRDGNHADAFDGRGLRRVAGGHDDLLEARVASRQREAQRTAHGADLPIQAELSHEHAAHRDGRTNPANPEQPDRHGQIQGGAALAEVRRREIDGDGTGGERVSAVAQGRADALTRLPDRRVGQTHDRETRQPVGGIDLHVEHASLHTERGGGMNASEHETSSEPREA